MRSVFGRNVALAWSAMPLTARRMLGVVVALVAVLLVFKVSVALQSAHHRLAQKERQAVADGLALQETLAQWRALQARKPLPLISAGTMREAVSASLQKNGLTMVVTPLDDTRIRLQGDVDFDRAMAWLGQLQQAQRLTVAAMTATRGAGTTNLELVLSAVPE
ncbi:MAG: hypothetical protein EKK46_01430 [Rhodocyclaceae bacterium]|nr:MAG: hypothetical protein EKK46_01430 [Rhodocyclaceae bacterium]